MAYNDSDEEYDDIIEEEEEEDEDFHDIDDALEQLQIDANAINSTWSKPMITKFEKTSIIGSRAESIANGAKPFMDIGNMYNPIEIAEKEFNAGLLNFNIIRSIPTQNLTSYVEYVVKPENLIAQRTF